MMSLLGHYASIAGRAAVVYLTLLAALRLAGKRHTGHLSPHDLVLTLLVAEALQNAIVGADVSLTGGVTAAVVLVAINVALTRFLLQSKRWGPVLAGKPTLLIYNGRVLGDQLDREGILLGELEAQIRGHGFERIEQVRFAIEEADGSISVIGFGGSGEHRLPPVAAW